MIIPFVDFQLTLEAFIELQKVLPESIKNDFRFKMYVPMNSQYLYLLDSYHVQFSLRHCYFDGLTVK